MSEQHVPEVAVTRAVRVSAGVEGEGGVFTTVGVPGEAIDSVEGEERGHWSSDSEVGGLMVMMMIRGCGVCCKSLGGGERGI